METKRFKNYEVYKLGNVYTLVSTKLTDRVKMVAVPDTGNSGLIMPSCSKIYLSQGIGINCNLNTNSITEKTSKFALDEHYIVVSSKIIDDNRASLGICVGDNITQYIYNTKPIQDNTKLDAFWIVIEEGTADNQITMMLLLSRNHSEYGLNLVVIDENVYAQMTNEFINFSGDTVYVDYDGEYEIL